MATDSPDWKVIEGMEVVDISTPAMARTPEGECGQAAGEIVRGRQCLLDSEFPLLDRLVAGGELSTRPGAPSN